MSADGEIDIAVKAEGAQDAAAEIADSDESEVDQPGPGDGQTDPTGTADADTQAPVPGDGGGGLRGNLKSGAIAGLLLSLLGPLLDVLSPILKVLQAFLAPISVMLMRLLTPVLRFLIQLLPGWMQFINELPGKVDGAIEWLQRLPGRIWSFMESLPGMIWRAIKAGASWITEGAIAIGEAVWSKIKAGASWITEGATAIGEAVWSSIKSGAAWLAEGVGVIGKAVWSRFKAGASWITDIATALQGIGVSIIEDADPRTGGGGPFGLIGGTEEDPGFFRALGQDAKEKFGLAEGGIVTGPTNALIGEAGPEAVIPLDRLESMLDTDRSERPVSIEFSGGLSEFVTNVERSPNVDFVE